MLYLATWGVERDLESGNSGSKDCNQCERKAGYMYVWMVVVSGLLPDILQRYC